MRCGQQCYAAQRRRRLRGALVGIAGQAKASSAPSTRALPAVLSGTWDFKWPSGAKLRIAFQRLPRDVVSFDADFEAVRALVLGKLDSWLGGGSDRSTKIANPNLSYEMVSDLPPPPLHSQGSPRSAKSDVRFSGFVEYDVLISLLPLPVLLPATEQHSEEAVNTSVSELGRYAHRIEYGVPTIYLGPQPGLTASQWFSSAEGLFTVVHELGHMLGMPHEQQNPLLPGLSWRPLPEIAKILENRDGQIFNDDPADAIRADITDPWPGEVMFSDWRPPPANIEAGLDSVMARPTYRCLLQGGHPDGLDCKDLKVCPHEQQALSQLQSPTTGDLKHLLAMYGSRAP